MDIITTNEKKIIIRNCDNFNISKTLECGQCFRWDRNLDGSYTGIIENTVINIMQNQESTVEIKFISGGYSKEFIIYYFDLKRDYEKINTSIADLEFIGDSYRYSKGIRILKQSPWEILISFIISQNNNIKRIKGIINNLCRKFGKRIIDEYYSFPSLNELSNISIKDLESLKCGFRDKYIIDAIEKINNKIIVLEDIYDVDTESARQILKLINGVGDKVADCILLYGFSKTDCFPTDIWIKRTLEKFFPENLPNVNKNYLGIIQQYMFYYVRSNSYFFFNKKKK